MIEKEFKDLLSDLELDSTSKKEINSLIKSIIDSISSNLNKNFKVLCLKKAIYSNLFNKEKNIDFTVCFDLKNKVLPYDAIQVTVMNEIENCIYLNIKNNIIFKDNRFTNAIRDYNNNTLKIVINDYTFIFNLYFTKDSLIKIDSIFDEKTFLYHQYLIEEQYFTDLKKNFIRFENTITIIKNYLIENNLYISDRIINYILAYSLSYYFEENTYISYLHAFIKALKDLIDNKTLAPKEEDYQKYKVFGTISNKGRFHLLSIASKQENLLINLDSNPELIKDFKELRSKIISLLPKDGKYVSINVNPNFVTKGKTIEWCFKIINTDITNNGGEYEYNDENYYMCVYKAMLKGLQFVAKNKLGNNIVIICDTLEPFKKENQSYENESRYANVLAFIKDNDFGIEYKEKQL